MENKGQKTESWSHFWQDLSPENEIKMWDYYGLRHWILKYTPRFGKVIEAGCGLGRYNFYLSKLGINIEGVDFESSTIQYLNKWKKENGFDDCEFIVGDVTNLPYDDNSLSGYISLGVIEHFIEGPQKPLAEALRVLRPGGIAIISTPSISWYIFYRDYIKQTIKNFLKKILRRKIIKHEFFQYWYRPNKLKNYVKAVGFYISRSEGADLLYSFIEASNFKIRRWTNKSLPVVVSNIFENTFFKNIGAQSIVIAIKVDEIMHCFLCGEKKATKFSLKKFDIPICNNCEKLSLSSFYLRNKSVKYHAKIKVFPEVTKNNTQICEFCRNEYTYNPLFENYGFTKNVCEDCLRRNDVNILLANTSIQPILRDRKSN